MFCTRLKELRQKKNMSQEAFARITEVSQRQYSFYENGKAEPSRVKLKNIALETGVSLDWLILGEGEMFRSNEGESVRINADNKSIVANDNSSIDNRNFFSKDEKVLEICDNLEKLSAKDKEKIFYRVKLMILERD